MSKSKLKERFQEQSSWQAFVKEIYESILNNRNIIRNHGKNDFRSLLRNLLGVGKEANYFFLNWEIKRGAESFSLLSQGQRKLMLLQLYLAYSEEDYPVLIDQPESDLDNKSIYDKLATYLRRKKKTRQIIMVTHNPNLVVGGDAENVIVADQQTHPDGEPFFSYLTGSLENTFGDTSPEGKPDSRGIRENVCVILEGGKVAFDNRSKKFQDLRGEGK